MITVSWAGALALVAVIGLIAWIAGTVRGDNWRRQDFADLVGYQRREATALRMLYEATGYEFPDDDNTEPELAVSRIERVKAWALAVWERTRPTEVEAAEESGELLTTNPISSELVDDPEPEPTTDEIPAAPPTVPDLRKASAVAPLPTVLTDDEEWAATRDRMLAEFRADMDKIQAGAK